MDLKKEPSQADFPQIMLWGWFGFENLGDDILLNTMLQRIRGDITVPMHIPYGQQGVREISRSYKNLVVGVFSNDVLIIGPGGLFPFDNKSKVLLYYLVSKIWKMLGRKVIFFGIGISERMSSFSAALWRKISQNSDLFIPRSKKVLERIGVNETKNIHSMADAVFASGLVQAKRSINSNKIVISVANLKPDNERVFKETTEKWIEVIKNLLEKGFLVDLIAFTKDNDEKMLDEIMASPQIAGKVRPIYYRDAYDAISNWNEYKFAVCMRFHSLVLSVLAGIPAVPIAYGHKTLSLAEKCGLTDYTLIWNTFENDYYGKSVNISAEQLIEKVNQLCISFDDVKSKVMKYRDELINSASEAFCQLDNIL